MTNAERKYNGDKTVLSINGPGTTGYPHVDKKRKNLPQKNINSKCIRDLNVKHNTIKFLANNIKENLLVIRFDNEF